MSDMEQRIIRSSPLRLFIGFVVCGLLFGLIAFLTPMEFGVWLDDTVYGLLSRTITDTHTAIATTFSNLVLPIPMLIILLPFFALFFVNGYHFSALSVAICAGLTTLAANGVKVFFDRPRPDVPWLAEGIWSSFPSAHAALAMAFFGVLMWYVLRCARLAWPLRYGIAAVLMMIVLIIGASRVYLGVHYATDVLAGFAFGGGIAFGFLAVQSLIVNTLTNMD